MSVFSSSRFLSYAAHGEDWRVITKDILENIEAQKTTNDDYNIGFLYISDSLVEDAEAVLNMLRDVLEIKNWVGAVGIGVCGQGQSLVDTPAISVMIGHIPPEEFCVFDAADDENLQRWLSNNTPMTMLVHGDPISEQDPSITLTDFSAQTNGFLIGGLSSSRSEHIQYANDMARGDLSGVAFSYNIQVATTLSQGCTPIGPIRTITRGDDHVIREIDDAKAAEAFEADLHEMAKKRLGQNPDEILIEEAQLYEDDPVPEEFQPLFKGEIHVAFPVSQSDQKDYLVRNIIGIDPDEGAIAVSETVGTADRIVFVHRDGETVINDLKESLTQLKARVEKDTGTFEPKGGIYISCIARGSKTDDSVSQSEMSIIKEIIGDIPLAGFYAGGEISNARLYGYTGILTLFL